MKRQSFFDKLFARKSPRGMRRAQRFDSAFDNPADRGTWARADSLSIIAALDPNTRQKSRNRARYLMASNSYAYGAASAIVSAVCGTMPRLQLSDDKADSETLTRIENDFTEWAGEIELADKLRTMRFARFMDGETFAILVSNPTREHASGVTLDVCVIDCARVAAPLASPTDVHNIDGVIVDDYGVPVAYRILDYNPGNLVVVKAFDSAKIYPAQNVCHWFKKQYPEQVRGITELAPALELFALIDRYSKAVVQASETAADLAMVIHTDGADDDAAMNIDDSTPPFSPGTEQPFVQFPWMRGLTMTLPEGWDAKQINAEQPSNSYSMLVDEILAQIGSAINVPKLMMKNSAENYNYSSARVDIQNFQNAARLDRDSLCHTVLNPIWKAWYAEYRALNSLNVWPSATWYFDGFFHVDPLKEANAQIARVNAGLSTLASEYGAKGKDWEREIAQIAREKARIKELEEEYGIKLTSGDNVSEPTNTTTTDNGETE